MNQNYDIQDIEKALAEAVKGISSNIYEGSRPNMIPSDVTNFIVCSVPTSLTDRAAYGECTSRIEWFVKNQNNGTKNSLKLSSMYKSICNAFPIESEKYLFDVNPSIIPLGNDNNGFHVQAIQIHTLIKAV